mmetsp:Transcript_8615/g.27045  ORF Transcript_8615/g.27045 Transcript_8615/m.27045 type:complete len:205 (-) Transcript_8615:206-820(-)
MPPKAPRSSSLARPCAALSCVRAARTSRDFGSAFAAASKSSLAPLSSARASLACPRRKSALAEPGAMSSAALHDFAAAPCSPSRSWQAAMLTRHASRTCSAAALRSFAAEAASSSPPQEAASIAFAKSAASGARELDASYRRSARSNSPRRKSALPCSFFLSCEARRSSRLIAHASLPRSKPTRRTSASTSASASSAGKPAGRA